MKVSFVTTVFGRLDHLKKTLPHNIKNNAGPDVEFIILNYGETPGLFDWLRNSIKILNRPLRDVHYYQTKNHSHYQSPHAKNLAHAASTGDIIVNLDADIYLPKDFANDVKCLPFESFGHTYVKDNPDICGLIAVHRSDFFYIRGYDESFDGHGLDDVDLVKRLLLLKLPEVNLAGARAISHSDAIRWQHMHPVVQQKRRILHKWKLQTVASRVHPSYGINPSGFASGALFYNEDSFRVYDFYHA